MRRPAWRQPPTNSSSCAGPPAWVGTGPDRSPGAAARRGPRPAPAIRAAKGIRGDEDRVVPLVQVRAGQLRMADLPQDADGTGLARRLVQARGGRGPRRRVRRPGGPMPDRSWRRVGQPASRSAARIARARWVSPQVSATAGLAAGIRMLDPRGAQPAIDRIDDSRGGVIGRVGTRISKPGIVNRVDADRIGPTGSRSRVDARVRRDDRVGPGRLARDDLDPVRREGRRRGRR